LSYSLQWVNNRNGSVYRTPLQLITSEAIRHREAEIIQSMITKFLENQLIIGVVEVGESVKTSNQAYEKIKKAEQLSPGLQTKGDLYKNIKDVELRKILRGPDKDTPFYSVEEASDGE